MGDIHGSMGCSAPAYFLELVMSEEKELILKWLTWKGHNEGRMPGTTDKYLRYLEELAQWLTSEKGTRLIDASPEDLEEFTGIEAHRRGITPVSRRPMVSAIRGFYSWAAKRSLMFEDPAENLPYPRAGKRLPKGIDLRNAERLMMEPGLDTFLGVRDTAILAVFAGCGLRLSGVVGLNQSDLIFVDDEGQERLVVRVTEKGDKERYIPAPHETRLLLRAYLNHPDLKAIDRRLPDGDQVLFVSVNDRRTPPHEYYGDARRISRRSVAEMIEKYGKRCGIPREQCSPHKLRHLFGTELVESDVNILKVQTLMGHSDPKTTKEYVNVAMRSLAEAIDRANPLSKMKLPVTDLARHLSRS
jgi:site-specific recombinase XerD